MEVLCATIGTDMAAILYDIGNNEDFRVPWKQELGQDVFFERAEAAGESDLIRGGDMSLVAEEKQRVLGKRASDLQEGIFIQRRGHIEVHDAGA
jgi:hypothetical protein